MHAGEKIIEIIFERYVYAGENWSIKIITNKMSYIYKEIILSRSYISIQIYNF